jgi:ferric-dicitrate binding protein FerR (iron transport regulator)
MIKNIRLDSAQLERQLAWPHTRFDFVGEPSGNAVERLNRYNRRRLLIGGAAADWACALQHQVMESHVCTASEIQSGCMFSCA